MRWSSAKRQLKTSETCRLKNRILEVLAYARVVLKRNKYTDKYVKYIVVLVIKQMLHSIGRELAEFL